MTAVTLPASPGSRVLGWTLVDFGGTLKGALGGSTQRLNRLGNRWRVDLELPVMTAAQAREWSADLVAGRSNGVLWKLRQVGLDIGSPGTPLVNGASQSGNTLACDGFSASYEAKKGQFFSIIISGQRYCYQVRTTTTAVAGAFAALPIETALRVSPADNATLEFAEPYIQGLLTDVPSWVNDADHLARGFSFAIEESR